MKINKQKLIKETRNYFLITLGVFIMTFGTVIFLTKGELVSGGISGIAIIVQHFVPNFQIYDIVVAVLTVIFWIIGRLFVSKSFAYRTLYASVIYIGFTFICTRVPLFLQLADNFYNTGTTGDLIICSMFGGVFIGGGVALAYLGGGSTGGVDVIQFILYKHFKIKQSITSVIIDAIIILVGMVSMQLWKESLCGILCCVLTAILIELIFIKSQSSYVMDVISSKWEEISYFAQEEMGRGATIIPVRGGFEGDSRIMLRIVFDRSQYETIREYIASVDPKAFMTISQTNATYGEGFTVNKKKPKITFKKPNK